MHVFQEDAEPDASEPFAGLPAWPEARDARQLEFAEFESGLVTVGHAFQRWALRCMAACGMTEMTITDVLVLHHVNHRARGKKLADVAFILNIEDAHVVNYSLKKLQGFGLVRTERHGKEVLYSTNARGRALCSGGDDVVTGAV